MNKTLNWLYDYPNLKVYQYEEAFKFSLDSILLFEFAEIKQSDEKIIDFCTGNAVIPILITNKYHKELNKYSAKYGIAKDSNNMQDNFLPSCQMVQSAYYEMYDCYCNHYTAPIKWVPTKWEDSDKEEYL